MSGSTAGQKPGYQTAAFWLTLLTQLLGYLYASGAITAGGAADKLIGYVVMILAAAGYSVNRGIVKLGAPTTKPAWLTTEFWLTILAGLVGLIQTSGVIVSGTVVEKLIGVLVTLLGLLGYQVGHGLATGNQKGITIETFGTLAPGPVSSGGLPSLDRPPGPGRL